MILQQVIYNKGDNVKFDYFILKQKENIKLDKESLAYQFDKTDDYALAIDNAGVDSNFDLLLEIKLKTGERVETVLCNLEDIDLI